MLPVLLGDVTVAVRALMAVPEVERTATLRRILAEAKAAHLYKARSGRAHPVWGNGSLMAAAARYPRAREAGFSDPAVCECFLRVVEAIRPDL